MLRTNYCAKVNEDYLGKTVSVCGWVNKRRDHGGVIFIDLRDTTGLVQVVINPEEKDIFPIAEKVRNEYCLQIKGEVIPRLEGTENSSLESGKIEIHAKDLKILSSSLTPPFQLEDSAGEETRLRYRYIDLRRPKMQENFRLRSRVTHNLRNFLEKELFLEIETPILTKATPEGARDYLVPSRTHQNEFFALPQSPQLFKQLLMMSGMDRYYQFARCFRDEDLRADRQPEFTQLDIETSFMDEDDIKSMTEKMIKNLFKDILNVDIGDFPQITYKEAMEKYGSDKPDLRIDLVLEDIKEEVKNCEFKVFSEAAKSSGSRVAALRVPKGSEKLTRKDIDDYTKYVSNYGAKGLAYIKVNNIENGVSGLQSPIIKFLGDDTSLAIMKKLEVENGDIVFFGADKEQVVNDALGALRVKIGHDLSLLNKEWSPLWVIDFPMFEYDEDEKRYVALHHPFTSPKLEKDIYDIEDPKGALSKAYDMVLNGMEIGGGSIRIHDMNMQKKVFEWLAISKEEAEEKFGFLLEALQYGCPPHGGIAFGLDRLVMAMAGEKSIRDVIAFPKTQSAACLLTGAPGGVSGLQLKELNLRHRSKE